MPCKSYLLKRCHCPDRFRRERRPDTPTEHYQLAQGSLSHVGRPIMERNMIELADRKEEKGIVNKNQYVHTSEEWSLGPSLVKMAWRLLGLLSL